jgi:peptidase E
MAVRIMLGPQTTRPKLGAALESVQVDGPLVSITAGWRDSEGEVEELARDIGHPVEDLGIYQRAEAIFAQEPELLSLHRRRQDKLQELQRLYRMRLNAAMAAARKLLRSDGDPGLLRHEQRAAIAQVRALDRHHIRRIAAIHREFDENRARISVPAAAEQREAVQRKVREAGLVLIAGGHVAVLLNRIRLFRLEGLLVEKPVIGWSAGAMVLGERIVLFHDNAPQGRRDAEVLDAGLGIVAGLVPLPHARERLDWSSRVRMALFSRRFAPAKCVTLDAGSLLRIEDSRVTAVSGCALMTRTGRKRPWTAP